MARRRRWCAAADAGAPAEDPQWVGGERVVGAVACCTRGRAAVYGHGWPLGGTGPTRREGTSAGPAKMCLELS